MVVMTVSSSEGGGSIIDVVVCLGVPTNVVVAVVDDHRLID